MGVAVSALLSAALAWNAEPMLMLFTDRTEMLGHGMVLVLSQCITMTLHVWSVLANGLFQATGKALRAGLLGLSRQVLSLIPCAVILNRIWGIDGLTRAQATADVVSFMIAAGMTAPMIWELRRLRREHESAEI